MEYFVFNCNSFIKVMLIVLLVDVVRGTFYLIVFVALSKVKKFLSRYTIAVTGLSCGSNISGRMKDQKSSEVSKHRVVYN